PPPPRCPCRSPGARRRRTGAGPTWARTGPSAARPRRPRGAPRRPGARGRARRAARRPSRNPLLLPGRALQVGDETVAVGPGHHLPELPSVGAPLVEDGHGVVDYEVEGRVLTIGSPGAHAVSLRALHPCQVDQPAVTLHA